MPRTMTDSTAFLAALIFKVHQVEKSPASQSIVAGVAELMDQLFENFPLHVESSSPETILNSLLIAVRNP